jgi:hypothetical protein
MNGSEKSDDVVVAGKPPNNAGTIRSIYGSRDILDDKETVLRQNQREEDHPPWCWSGPSGRADARGAEGGTGRLALRQPM